MSFRQFFFDTPELAKIVLPKVLQFWQSFKLLIAIFRGDRSGFLRRSVMETDRQGYVGWSLALNQKVFLMFAKVGGDQRGVKYGTFFHIFFNPKLPPPSISRRNKAFCEMATFSF